MTVCWQLIRKALRNITSEDGNFTLEKKATDSQIKRLEKEGVQIYENYYVEEDADTDLDGEKDSTVRVYKNRSQIDLVCL